LGVLLQQLQSLSVQPARLVKDDELGVFVVATQGLLGLLEVAIENTSIPLTQQPSEGVIERLPNSH